MFTMDGFILWDKMKTTDNNGHNVYNGWFYPLGQDVVPKDKTNHCKHGVGYCMLSSSCPKG
jgi:hypothetical protein